LLAYDRFRRASLLDGLFPESGFLDPLHPWEASWLTLGDHPMATEVSGTDERVTVTFSSRPEGPHPLEVRKEVIVPSGPARLDVVYRLGWGGKARARWGVQWNLAMTAGEAPGRYLRLPGQPSLGGAGSLADCRGLSLVDEWLGAEVALGWRRPARVAWAPVETVSLSEAGFERIYQGLALFLCWPVDVGVDATWEERLTLRVVDLPRETG
jgi:alpha-amylase